MMGIMLFHDYKFLIGMEMAHHLYLEPEYVSHHSFHVYIFGIPIPPHDTEVWSVRYSVWLWDEFNRRLFLKFKYLPGLLEHGVLSCVFHLTHRGINLAVIGSPLFR